MVGTVTIISADENSYEKIVKLFIQKSIHETFFTAPPFSYELYEKSLDEFAEGFPVQANILYLTREEGSFRYKVKNPKDQEVEGTLTTADCRLLEPWFTQNLFVMDGFPGSEPIDFERLDIPHGQVYVISGSRFFIVSKIAKTCVPVDVTPEQQHQLLAVLNFEQLWRGGWCKTLGQAELALLESVIGKKIELPFTTAEAVVTNVECIFKNSKIHVIYDERRGRETKKQRFVIDLTEDQCTEFVTKLNLPDLSIIGAKWYKTLDKRELTLVADIINPILIAKQDAQISTSLKRIASELGRDDLLLASRQTSEQERAKLLAKRGTLPRQHVGLPSISHLSIMLPEISKITEERGHTRRVVGNAEEKAHDSISKDIDRQERYLVECPDDLEYLVALWLAQQQDDCYVQGGADNRIWINAMLSFIRIWRKFLLDFTGPGHDMAAATDEKRNLTKLAFCYLTKARETGAFAAFCKTGAPEIWMAFNTKRPSCSAKERVVTVAMPTMMIPKEVNLNDPSLGLTVSVVESSTHIPWNNITESPVGKIIPLFFNDGVCEKRVNFFNDFESSSACSRIHSHPSLQGVAAIYYNFAEVESFLENVDATPAALDHTETVLAALRTEEFETNLGRFITAFSSWRATTDSFLADETRDHELLVPSSSDVLGRGQIHITLPAAPAAKAAGESPVPTSINYAVMDPEGSIVTGNITIQDLPALAQALNEFSQKTAARKRSPGESEETRRRISNATLTRHLRPLLLDILKLLSAKKHIEIENVRLLREFSQCCQELLEEDKSPDHNQHRRALMILAAQYARCYEWDTLPSARGLEFLEKLITSEVIDDLLKLDREQLKPTLRERFNNALLESFSCEQLERALLKGSLQHLKSHLSDPRFLPSLSAQQRAELETLNLVDLQQRPEILPIIEANLPVVLCEKSQLTWSLVEVMLQPILGACEEVVGVTLLSAQRQELLQIFVDSIHARSDIQKLQQDDFMKEFLGVMTNTVFPACCTFLMEKINKSFAALSPENLNSVFLKQQLISSFFRLLRTLKQELPWVVEYCGENGLPNVVANIERFPPAPVPPLLSDAVLESARKSLKANVSFQETLSMLDRQISLFPAGRDVNKYKLLGSFLNYCKAVVCSNNVVDEAYDALRMLITQYSNWHKMTTPSISVNYPQEAGSYIESALRILRRSLRANIREQGERPRLVAAAPDHHEPRAAFLPSSPGGGAAAVGGDLANSLDTADHPAEGGQSSMSLGCTAADASA